RRAFAWPGSDDREADLQRDPGHQPEAAYDHFPGRAERLPCAAAGPSRLRDGQRPHHPERHRQGAAGQRRSAERLSRGRARLDRQRSMEEFIGTSVAAFIGVTLILFGGASFMMGQAIGATWRPGWQVVPYGLGIGAANQFLTFALFQGPLLDPLPYLVRTAILIAIALFAYRL